MSMRSRSPALVRMAPLVASCILLTLGSAALTVAASSEVEPNDTAAQAQLLTLPSSPPTSSSAPSTSRVTSTGSASMYPSTRRSEPRSRATPRRHSIR
jgi:hypothetical protein